MTPDRRPVVAITAGQEFARWGVGWEGDAVLLPVDYVDAVRRAGALPLVVPPDAGLADRPDELLDIVDALLFAGGPDVEPRHYGAQPAPGLESTEPLRDVVELALVRRALERDIPFLGICRGVQLMNVATGGSLHQHLPDVLGHAEHRRRIATFEGNRHEVELEEGSLIARLEGATRLVAASHHHQGVDRVGAGLLVTARSRPDGLPEALEAEGRRFCVGVQWHPEIEEEGELITALVAAAAPVAARVAP